MASEPHDTNTLAAYVEGRLDPGEEALVAAHAAECAECRAVIAALARSAGPNLPAVSAGTSERAYNPAPLTRFLLPLAATLAIGTIAALMVTRLNDARPEPAAPVTAAPERPPAPAEAGKPVEQQPARPPAGTNENVDDQGLLLRRSGERRVAGKVFRLTAGEWIDQAYRSACRPSRR